MHGTGAGAGFAMVFVWGLTERLSTERVCLAAAITVSSSLGFCLIMVAPGWFALVRVYDWVMMMYDLVYDSIQEVSVCRFF
jgi:hypothetical protein